MTGVQTCALPIYYVEIRLKDGENPQKLLRDFVKVAEVYRFEIVEPSLNEIFIETVKSEN